MSGRLLTESNFNSYPIAKIQILLNFLQPNFQYRSRVLLPAEIQAPALVVALNVSA